MEEAIKNLGAEHPDVLASPNNLANVLFIIEAE